METFIARQPIFDQRQSLYGYELLFRSSMDNVFNGPDPDHASARVIADSQFVFDVQAITRGKRAFINVTQSLLVGEGVTLCPPEHTVLEILESVTPDREVIAACRRLKDAGYLLALDDFRVRGSTTPLVELADIIKIDFLATEASDRRALVKRFGPTGVRLLAEKVETPAVFREALDAGYAYFQGYFFAKPTVLRTKALPEFKLTYVRMLQEILRPEMDFRRLESILERDVTLSYKLLRYVNSAYFGLRGAVRSLMDALLLLGEREIRKWAAVVALASMGKDKPDELVVQAAVRARLCEGLGCLAGVAHRAGDLFLMGLFSVIDAILDRPLDAILAELPIADDVKAALLGAEGFLREIHDCVVAYTMGNWGGFSGRAGRLAIDEAKAPRLYGEALGWANQMLPAWSTAR